MGDKKPDSEKGQYVRLKKALNSERMERKGMTNIAQTQPPPKKPPKQDK